WTWTGVGRYIRNLVIELQKIDHENQYVLFISKQDISEVSSQIKNPHFSIVSTDIHWHSLKEQIYLSRLIKKEAVDLMHFPYFSVPLTYNGQFVVTIHDLIINHF